MTMKKSTIIICEKVIVTCLVIGSVAAGAFFGYITSSINNFSGIQELKRFQPSVPTKLYDVNGELIAELFQEKRDIVSYEELPPNLINAFLATEDKDFFNHIGVSPVAIFRATIKNVLAGSVVQGGSTITQQLAKRLFTKSEKKLSRKIKEVVLALQIEKKFSKEEILEMYFNQIYLGHGCYGISAATNLFFNKEVRYINVAESSVLAALPSAPGRYSPLRNPHNAFEKNKDILRRMIDEGYLTKERSDKISQEFWPKYIDTIKMEYPSKTAFFKNVENAPFFTDYVRQILLARFGKDVVYNEGLNVYTTLNLKQQKIAEKYLLEALEDQNRKSAKANQYYSSGVDRSLFGAYEVLRMIFSLPFVESRNDLDTLFQKHMADSIIDSADMLSLLNCATNSNIAFNQYRGKTSAISTSMKVQGAMITIEAGTGYITTMIGGSEYTVDNQLNRAVQAKRQPGSSFKPFVYGAAIESGAINAGTALPDAPIVDIDVEGKTWSPDNYEGNYSGMMRIRRALAASINVISVRIFDLVGADCIINYASKMLKIDKSRFNMTPSLALGSAEVTPFEMAQGYAIYANKGRDVIPFAIRYVVNRDGTELINTEEEVGNIIAAREKAGTMQIISPEVAFVMTSLMQEVVDHGTASEAIRVTSKFSKQCAGKTGTTSNWSDAWFCGFTADMASVVWFGYDKAYMTLGKHQAGAALAAPVWGKYMREVYNGKKDPIFSGPPAGVYRGGVCSYTGLIPIAACKDIAGDWMIKGKGPSKFCDGNHFKMKSIMDMYMESTGLSSGE